MEDHDWTIRRIAWILLAASVFALVLFSLYYWLNFPTGLLAIPAFSGILGAVALFSKSDRANRVATGLAAAFAGFLASASVIFFVNEPADLLLVSLRTGNLSTFYWFISELLGALFACWVYIQLVRSPVTEAKRHAGISFESFWWAVLLGRAIAWGSLFGLNMLIVNGPDETAARAKANELYGNQYEYYVSGRLRSPNGKHTRMTT